MIRFDRGHARFLAWIFTSSFLIIVLYSNPTGLLVSGLGNLLSSTLGTVYPAYPFLALLLFLTVFRWSDFHKILLAERGMVSMPVIRIVGLFLILLPMVAWNLEFWQSDPYLWMEFAAVSIVLVVYGTLLTLNPSMWRVMLPYALLYTTGLVSPLIMLDVFGGVLVALSSHLTAGIVNALGIRVIWQGASFQFASVTGQQISAVIAAPCSAAYSISIYLALIGLMYLDMRKSLGTTAKFAIAGVAIIPLLNSARIAITIWFGYVGGPSAFWEVHDWLGYALFLALYLVTLAIYSRADRPGTIAKEQVRYPLSQI